MGSFNITCFASNQTISTRNRCRILPILQYNSFDATVVQRGDKRTEVMNMRGSTGYLDSFWRPLGNFLEGIYSDEGNTELDWHDRNRYELLNMLQVLLSRGWVTEEGENPSHDKAYNLEVFLQESAPGLLAKQPTVAGGALDAELETAWQYVWRLTRRGRVFASEPRPDLPRPLQFAIMHEHAYQALLALQSQNTNYRQEPFGPPAEFLRKAYHAAVDAADRREANMSLEDMGIDAARMQHLRFVTRQWAMADTIRESFRTLDGLGEPLQDSRELNEIAAAIGAVLKGTATLEDLIQQVMPFAEDRYVFAALQSLNLRLIPWAALGQDYSNSVGNRYLQFVQAVSQQVSLGQYSHYGDPDQEWSFDVISLAAAQLGRDLLARETSAIAEYLIEEREGGYRIRFRSPHEEEWLQEVLESVLA